MKKYCYMMYIVFLIFTTLSCKENTEKYDILNEFIQNNKIDLGKIQKNAYCFKDLHLSKAEENSLGINLKNDISCGNEIEVGRLTQTSQKNKMMSQLSFPLQSTDGSVFIILSYYDINLNNYHRLTTLYKLRRINGHWKIIDNYKIITES